MSEGAEPATRVAFLLDTASRTNGGIFTAASSLASELTRRGATKITVFASEDGNTDEDRPRWSEAEVITVPTLPPRAFRYAPQLKPLLERHALDVVHLHGIWQYQSIAARQVAQMRRIPIVVSPHGALQPWALNTKHVRKKLALAIYERRNLAAAHCLHALSPVEIDDIRSLGLRNPVALIPNGVSMPDRIPDRAARTGRGDPFRLLFLGRLHPKKGIAELLRGWAAYRAKTDRSASWELDIVGWGDDAYVAELKALVSELGIGSSVSFLGPRFGTAIWDAYASADAFALTSHSEGMAMAVLEAWAAGLPVIMTPECGLREGFAAGAAIPTSRAADDIASALRHVAGLAPAARAAMGAAGARLVAERYSSARAAAAWEALYVWLLKRGTRPDFVLEP